MAVSHSALMEIKAQVEELTQGRINQGTTKAGTLHALAEHPEELVRMLHGMSFDARRELAYHLLGC